MIITPPIITPPIITPPIITKRRRLLMRGTALQLAAAAFLAGPALAQPAPNARPQGGVVVGGAASIGQTPTVTTIAQTSQRAAIDWRRFDVGRDQTVLFQQPGATAVTLNRVIGPDPSQIAGRIQANGQVVITNQSGVMVSKGAQIDTGGLVLSAAGIRPAAFIAGSTVFDQAPNPDAVVSNAGTITIQQAGLAALVAPRVANAGVIRATLGHVVLAGAATHTLDLYGDGLLSIDVTQQVRQAPRGADGRPVTALVTNTGVIRADGGTVTLTAAAADGVVQTLVQAGGVIAANAMPGRRGTVVLAGVGGSLRIEGRVAADALAGVGGTVTADATGGVTVAAGARITANGAAGGGAVSIGSRTAGPVTVRAGARIAANAGASGDGGTVQVISAGAVSMNGRIAVRGGRTGGHGGAAEISGTTLGLTGTVDAAAPAGRRGTLLIDPTDIIISKAAGPNTVDPALLVAMKADVTLLATNSVIASDSVTLTQAGQNMTLNGGNLVRIDKDVTLTVPGNLTLAAGAGGVSIFGSLATGLTGQRLVFNTTGAVTQGPGSAISTSDVVGAVGSAALSSPLNRILAAGSLDVSLVASAGGIAIVTSTPLTVAGGIYGAGIVGASGSVVSLTTDSLRLFSRASPIIAAPGGTIAIQPLSPGLAMEVTSGAATPGALSIPTSVLGRLVAPTLSLGSAGAGALTLAPDGAPIDFGAAGFTTLLLASGGAITQAGAVATPNLVASGASITLGTAGNAIPALGGLSAAGDIVFFTGQGLTVNGAVTGANVALSAAGAAVGGATAGMTLNAGITGGTVSLDTYDGLSLGGSGSLVQNKGTITAQAFQGQASTATLNQPNAIAGIARFHTADGFALTNAGGLALTGMVQNDVGTVALTIAGAVTQTAGSSLITPVLSGTAQSLALTSATNLVQSVLGFTTSVGGLALTTTLFQPASAPQPSPLSLGGFIAVPSGQAIAIVADRVVTTADTGISAPGGSVSFAPLSAGTPMEVVATVAEQSALALSLTQADLSRIATATLTLGSSAAGPILIGQAGDTIRLTGIAATLSLSSSGAVTEGGGAGLAVQTLAATAASVTLGGANAIAQLGPVTASGPVSVVDAASAGQTLIVTGPVNAGGALTLRAAADLVVQGAVAAPLVGLYAGGSITEAGAGAIAATTLTGAAATVALTGPGNQVASIGPFLAQGGLTLTDARSLTVAGLIDPPDVTLNVNGDLAINSQIIANTLTLNVSGAVTEARTGAVTAATLTGRAGSVLLTGGNTIGTLAAFGATGGFTLVDIGGLTVSGPVQAAAVSVTALGALVLQGGGITADSIGVSGAGVTQTGVTALAPLKAVQAQATIQGNGRPVSLASLNAPAAAVRLVLGTAPASGTLTVGSLLVNGSGGRAVLSGSVAGQTGFAAAIAAQIRPAFDTAYTLNGCAIASTVCGTTAPPGNGGGTPNPPPATVPAIVPALVTERPVARIIERIVEPGTIRPDLPPVESALRPDLFTADLIQVDLARDPRDPAIVLPNISDRDY